MSSDDVGEGIQFTWKIVDFGYRKNHETLHSPFFISFSREWVVEIVSNSKKYFSVTVRNYTSEVKHNLTCSVAFLGCDGLPLIWQECKIPAFWKDAYFEDLITVSRLNSNKTKFLPNDTLTIQCRLWRTSKGPATPVSLFACTRIESTTKVIKETFNCYIDDVSSLEPPKYFGKSVTITDGLSATFKITLNKEGKFYVDVTTSVNNIHAKIEIAVLDAEGKKIEFAKGETEFKTLSQNWNLCTNVTKSMLLFYPNHFLPSDRLSLQFTCAFSGNVIFSRIVGENEFLLDVLRTTAAREILESSVCDGEPETNEPTAPHPPSSISQALQELLVEGVLADFEFRVGDEVFPVHKAILSARSRVFRAMFTKEWKEKENNCVDIPDVDVDTFREMLEFIYSDKFDEGMRWEMVYSLFVAADKYALAPLKQRCSTILQSELCPSNVFEVLSLVDLHPDPELKSATLDFIALNDQDIVGTDLWKEFENENRDLALDTLRSLYLKKMNGGCF